MASVNIPAQIVLSQLPEKGFSWSGDVPISCFKRVQQESIYVSHLDTSLAPTKQKNMPKAQHVYVRCDIFCESINAEQDIFWLELQALGFLEQECQRCLDVVATPMKLDMRIALLRHEDEAQWLPEDADSFLLADQPVKQTKSQQSIVSDFKQEVNARHYSIENILSTTKDSYDVVNLLALVEDELLLTLPIAPKHDNCDMAIEPVTEAIETPKDNPFAVLSDLKGKL